MNSVFEHQSRLIGALFASRVFHNAGTWSVLTEHTVSLSVWKTSWCAAIVAYLQLITTSTMFETFPDPACDFVYWRKQIKALPVEWRRHVLRFFMLIAQHPVEDNDSIPSIPDVTAKQWPCYFCGVEFG